MNVCTFFGHRDCPSTIIHPLEEVIVDLIVNHDVEMFYVGNQGQFHAYTRDRLCNIPLCRVEDDTLF